MPLTKDRKPLTRYWLLLGVSALAIAGLFSLVLVIARTPQLTTLPFFADLFYTALVSHVDLSTLVWFLSIICLFWSIYADNAPEPIPYLEASALICFALATLMIGIAPFISGEALMSNYIPVIHNPIFFLGLSFLLCGITLMMARFLAVRRTHAFYPPIKFALLATSAIVIIAIAAFLQAFLTMPAAGVINGAQYYEMVFWAGGHVLQFAYVQVAIISWLLLLRALDPHFSLNRTFLYAVFGIGLLVSAAAPLGYLRYDVISLHYRQFFTQLMIDGNGVAPVIFIAICIPCLWRTRSKANSLWSAVLISMVLFLYGGILGEMIQGQNVVIPAHYHGSIVGITLAFMGAAYAFLPRLGYRDVSHWKLAYWQPIVYGLGQALHISGLAWSGGYGVLRKTPGGLDDAPASVKAAMGLMGIGGLLAIIGGFMFVVVIYRSARKPVLNNIMR